MAAREDAWTKLGVAVREARSTRGLSYRDAAEEAQIAASTWLRLEHGKPIRDIQLASVAKTLEFPAGFVDRVLHGGADDRARLVELERRIDVLSASVIDLIKVLGGAEPPELGHLLYRSDPADGPSSDPGARPSIDDPA